MSNNYQRCPSTEIYCILISAELTEQSPNLCNHCSLFVIGITINTTYISLSCFMLLLSANRQQVLHTFNIFTVRVIYCCSFALRLHVKISKNNTTDITMHQSHMKRWTSVKLADTYNGINVRSLTNLQLRIKLFHKGK